MYLNSSLFNFFIKCEYQNPLIKQAVDSVIAL